MEHNHVIQSHDHSIMSVRDCLHQHCRVLRGFGLSQLSREWPFQHRSSHTIAFAKSEDLNFCRPQKIAFTADYSFAYPFYVITAISSSRVCGLYTGAVSNVTEISNLQNVSQITDGCSKSVDLDYLPWQNRTLYMNVLNVGCLNTQTLCEI